jgi:tRNA (Thr-GGU) A37 N-methylase
MVLAVEPGAIQVDSLEAVDGTPVIDIKPPIRLAEH